MNASVSVYQGVDGTGRASSQFARNVAYAIVQVMQAAGIRSLSIGFRNDAISRSTTLSSYETMEFAPERVKSLAPAFADAIASLFACCGVVSVSVDVSSANDRASLHDMWRKMAMDVPAVGTEAPKDRIVAPPGTADEIGKPAIDVDWSEIKLN